MIYRDQARAKAAYEAVARVHENEKIDAKEKGRYGRLCLRLPSLIGYNGLCQTLAFLEAKGKGDKKPEYGWLIGDLAKATKPAQTAKEFTESARSTGGAAYVRMTDEALRCAVYFKRYAEAVLKVDPTQGEEDT